MTKSTTKKKKDDGTVYKQILMDTKLRTGKRGQKTRRLGELHYGGEGPHWTVVPSTEEDEEEKKKNKNKKKKGGEEEQEEEGGNGGGGEEEE